MKQFVLYSLAFLGIALSSSSLASNNTKSFTEDQKRGLNEFAIANSDLPLIKNEENAIRTQNYKETEEYNRNLISEDALQDYFSLLPAEVRDYFMQFIDSKTVQSMSLVCKSLNSAVNSSKSLHRRRVYKWMNLGLYSLQRGLMLQDHLVFDKENFSLKVRSSLKDLPEYVEKSPLFSVTREMNKLELDLQMLSLYRKNDGLFIKLQTVRKLILTIALSDILTSEKEKIQWIPFIFTNINSFQLKLDLSRRLDIRFIDVGLFSVLTKTIFDTIPNLNNLTIRIINNVGFLSNRKNLIQLLKMLQDERIILKFYKKPRISEDLSNLAFDIFETDLKEQDKLYHMKERTFFFADCMAEIKRAILDNARQIHSLEFSIFNRNDSIYAFFSELGRFTELKRLILFLDKDIDIDSFPKLKSIFTVTNLTLRGFSAANQLLLSNVHVICPNVNVLHAGLGFKFKTWSDSLLKLKRLERLDIEATVTRQELYEMLKVVTQKAFPKLKIFYFPSLIYGDNITPGISLDNFIAFLDQWVSENPAIELMKIPDYIKDILSANKKKC